MLSQHESVKRGREGEMEEMDASKRAREGGTVDESQLVLKLLVPNGATGALIGKQGVVREPSRKLITARARRVERRRGA